MTGLLPLPHALSSRRNEDINTCIFQMTEHTYLLTFAFLSVLNNCALLLIRVFAVLSSDIALQSPCD
jgi:hypothetical protein